MRFLVTLACVTVASGAVARKIQTVGWDKYAEERGYAGHDDPMEHASVHAREADPEVTQAWEHAHGGKAPTYKGYGEGEHGHFVARSEHYDMEGHRDHESHGHMLPRDIPDFGGEDVDTSLEGYYTEAELHARSIPEFDEEDVDTSLEGYGDFGLHVRSVPDFGGEDVDTSLEGYDDHEIYARSEEDWEEEETKFLHHSATASHHSHETSRTAWTEHSAWAKPTHVARAIKDAWDHYSGKAGEAAENAKHRHYARNAKGKLVYSPEPVPDEGHQSEHGVRHYARDAEAAYEHGFREGMQHSDVPTHHQHARNAGARVPAGHGINEDILPYRPVEARNAEARVPAGYGIEEDILPYRPVEARNAEAHIPSGYHAYEHVNGFHRPHQARDGEPASAHHTAHVTASRTAWSEESGSWAKHTAAKTASPSKTGGGWGLPW
ncbi:hypothetical protein LTR85_012006 [Meristemomyces frigidus]|nr:hypothetical protein LTR85_012006 [Meristemomyces frigidus]